MGGAEELRILTKWCESSASGNLFYGDLLRLPASRPVNCAGLHPDLCIVYDDELRPALQN